jgi:arsenate reductase
MAEAFANHLGGGLVHARSAGSRPLGYIVRETGTVLEEKGISIEGHFSKALADVPLKQMDVVVTMGCEVECPVPAGFTGRTVEWNIPDPFARGLDYFRIVRDLIELQVKGLLEGLRQASQRPDSPVPPQAADA